MIKTKLFTILASVFLFSFGIHAEIIDKKMSTGFRTASARNIDVLVIHSVFNNSGGEFYDIDLIIKQFAQYGVSAHYLIGRGGEIYRLVDEKNIAYHAGKSTLPDGRTAVNSCSLGIEMVCSFTEPITEQQMDALVELTKNIQSRYKIKYVLRHSDIAPGRKTDPWNFDWEKYLLQIKSNKK
jgi:N-acetyl-anhydromuramyl-L-alanine amidase AmpD